MFLRWVTAGYLAYLIVPIALLLVGSFGELWLNTLLPTGSTTQWYRNVVSAFAARSRRALPSWPSRARHVR